MMSFQLENFMRVGLLQIMLLLAACSGSNSNGGGSDDALPTLSVSDQAVDERTTAVSFYVTLSEAVSSPASVTWVLEDGTAVAGEDYVAAGATLNFGTGVKQALVSLTLIDDDLKEDAETFYVRFSDAQGIDLLTERIAVTIAENDQTSWSNLSEFHPDWQALGAFDNAETCAACHSGASDDSGVLRNPKQADGEDIGPFAGWKHTPMAHAFDDPYYQAVVEDEVKHFPSLAGTIEDKCLTCHAPMARNHAHTTGIGLESDACLSVDGCYRMDDAHDSMAAREGISCTLCHQVDPGNLGSTFSGGYEIGDSKVIYGPYSDPVTGPMANNTRYTVTGGAHMQSSTQCAVCHDLKTPSVNVDTGQLTGSEFVEQAPYTEWFNSTFNEGDSGDKQCQDCHMPRIEGYSSQIATTMSGSANLNWPERDAYSQHTFVGGNAYLLELLRDYRTELGITNTTSVAGFNAQIERNRNFLGGQAAEITIDSVQLTGDELAIDVTVTNKAGHKLPTSFPSRRAWVNLIVKDAGGTVLFESGTPDANGLLEFDEEHASDTCAAVDKSAEYEQEDCVMPHYDVIDDDDEVAVYEAVMGDTNSQVTYVLLHGNVYLKDNRIPPAGFSSTSPRYNAEAAVVGAATSDSDFNRDTMGAEGTGKDTVHYRLDWENLAATGLQVEAKFYYQTIRPAFVSGLHNSGEKVDRFKWMYENRKPQPELLAQDSYSQP